MNMLVFLAENIDKPVNTLCINNHSVYVVHFTVFIHVYDELCFYTIIEILSFS